MARLRLNLACRWYDRVAGLIDGSIRAEGLDLNVIEGPHYETFWRVLRHAEFDVAELTLAGYLMMVDAGQAPYVAIPVFPSRQFRHGNIFVNKQAGIGKPDELRGKRVGVPDYSNTAAVWVRGILQDEYGVDFRSIHWFRGGIEGPDPVARDEPDAPAGVKLEDIPAGSSLNELLAAGELDAVIGPQAPSAMTRPGSNVARLFVDCRAAEMAYYRKTGLFPIMHLVVIRRSVYEAEPWVAASLMKAFEAAKAQCYERIAYTGVLSSSLPWLHPELEAQFSFFGRDPFVYGLEPNRAELETFGRYMHGQGLTKRLLPADELLAQEATDMFTTSSRAGKSGPIGPLRYIRQQ